MLSEFEQRLADVLGAGLPAPIQGAVDVAPGAAQSQVLVSVARAVPAEEDFRSIRSEQVPGAAGHRRVVRLACEVSLEVRQRQNQTRAAQIAALDSLLFFLDNPPFRSGRALDGGAPDPGFFLQSLTLRECTPPSRLTLAAAGYFWPIGTVGETGTAISQVLTRVVTEPLLLDPPAPRLVAGGPPVDLLLRLGATNAMDIREDGVDPRAFGGVLIRLTDAGGRPGGGTLTGGNAGPNGAQRLTVDNGAVAFTYTPPAGPATDILHVSFDADQATEIGQLEVRVRGSG